MHGILPVGFLLLSSFLCQRSGVIRRRPTRRRLAAVNAGGWFLSHALALLGQMLLVPAAKDLIPLFAARSRR